MAAHFDRFVSCCWVLL